MSTEKTKRSSVIMVLFSGMILSMRTKVGIAQQNYNVMDHAHNNYSCGETIRQDDAKNNIMSFLTRCEK